MKVIIKAVLFGYIITQFGLEGEVSYPSLAILLILIALQVWKEKFFDLHFISVATLILVCIGSYMDPRFGILFTIPLFDFVLHRFYIGIIPVLIALTYFLYSTTHFYLILLIHSIIGLCAYILQKSVEREERFTQTLDNERRLRYELEQAKAQLLHSSREIATIAEVKERNRIAREIHDSIGHSIAGILIQLQAAHKLYQKDETKAQEMVKRSIEGLADSVELLRKTVHNIKPQERLGVAYIQSIIDNYSFAPIDFRISGDFNTIPANHLEIVGTNIKEALTNAARYSQATKMDIKIDVNDQFTRIYIKDDGVGCKHIKEGLGISGMRERIRNIGGSLSISGLDGFLIVCLIPRHEGSGIFASTYR